MKREIESLLPLYESGALDEETRARVETWLRAHPEEAARLRRLHALKQVVQAEPQPAPPGDVLPSLRARVRRAPQLRPVPRWLQVLWGMALALACALLLWGAWHPGIRLQWRASGEAWTAFRVYRAPAGTTDFRLLAELPVSDSATVYRYTDSRVWPGKDYVYRVEAVTARGNVVLSDVVQGNSGVFATQAGSILLFSLGVGLLGWLFLPQGVLPLDSRRKRVE